MTKDTIKVDALEARPKFEAWIATRGGVSVWSTSYIGGRDSTTFTPALTEAGEPTPKPHWQFASEPEVVTDIARFQFAAAHQEVARFKVSHKQASAFSFKLTDASDRKVRKALAQYGEDASYSFDYDSSECIISITVWE